MTKKEFVKKLAEKLDTDKSKVSQKEASNILDAVLTSIEEALRTGDKQLTFVGWGSFKVVTRDAREGRNPQTGKPIKIAAKKVVRFKAGSSLEEKVNSSKR